MKKTTNKRPHLVQATLTPEEHQKLQELRLSLKPGEILTAPEALRILISEAQ